MTSPTSSRRANGSASTRSIPRADGAGLPAAVRAVCPYKGLAEFEAGDATTTSAASASSPSSSPAWSAARSSASSATRAAASPRPFGRASCRPSPLVSSPGSDRWPQAILRPGEHAARRARSGRRPGAPRGPTCPPTDRSRCARRRPRPSRAGGAACRRRRPVRGGLQRHPRRGGADRVHRPPHVRAIGPAGDRLDAGRPLRPLCRLPRPGEAPRLRPGPRRSALERRDRRGRRAARAAGRPAGGARARRCRHRARAAACSS